MPKLWCTNEYGPDGIEVPGTYIQSAVYRGKTGYGTIVEETTFVSEMTLRVVSNGAGDASGVRRAQQ